MKLKLRMSLPGKSPRRRISASPEPLAEEREANGRGPSSCRGNAMIWLANALSTRRGPILLASLYLPTATELGMGMGLSSRGIYYVCRGFARALPAP
jgi:hypothetical protein